MYFIFYNAYRKQYCNYKGTCLDPRWHKDDGVGEFSLELNHLPGFTLILVPSFVSWELQQQI